MTDKASISPLWNWPTLLSLDAPLIAVLWQLLLVRLSGVRLDLYHHLILALAVWLLYVADRWWDALELEPHKLHTQRHRFHARHRWTFLALWLTVLASSLMLVFAELSSRELILGFLLLAACLLYLLSVQRYKGATRYVPKELQIALLFPLGVGLFTLAQPGVNWLSLVLPLALLGTLAFINCGLIAVRERDIDHAQAQPSLAQQLPGLAGYLQGLSLGVLLVSLLLGVMRPAWLAFWVVTAVSALALYGLSRMYPRLEPPLLRVLVDAALLSPLLVLWLV